MIPPILGVEAALCGSTAIADLMNGGSETCDPTGWITTGTVGAVNWVVSRDQLGVPVE